MVDAKNIWEKHIYDFKEMGSIDNELDCSFLCKNVEKENSCNMFAFEKQNCYFGTSGHTEGLIETDLPDATIYITNGKFQIVHNFLYKIFISTPFLFFTKQEA